MIDRLGKQKDPMKKNTLILCTSLVLVFLTGCANKVQPTTTQQPARTKHAAQQNIKSEKALPQQAKSQKLEHWQAEGRVATKKGQKGNNASFVWLQRGESFRIRLYGPFGSGSAYITGRPNVVELKESNGKVTRARTAEELLQKVAHLNMPISGLRYWMTGNVSPHLPVSKQNLNAQGQLNYLEQQGWRIQYENYGKTNLPSKLQLQNGDVKVKLIVTNWQPLMSGTRKEKL